MNINFEKIYAGDIKFRTILNNSVLRVTFRVSTRTFGNSKCRTSEIKSDKF